MLVKMLRPLILIFLIVLFYKLVPTLASALIDPTPSPSPSDSATPISSASPDPASTVSPSPTSQSVSSTPSASPLPEILSNTLQDIQIQIPESLPVDPRARTIYLPQIGLNSSHNLLVCITSENSIDVFTKGQPDTQFNGQDLISGDLSNFVMISGSSSQISEILNSDLGTSIFNNLRPIQNSTINLAATAVSMPTLNSSFCGAALPKNDRIITLKRLDLTINMRKNSIPLRKTP